LLRFANDLAFLNIFPITVCEEVLIQTRLAFTYMQGCSGAHWCCPCAGPAGCGPGQPGCRLLCL